MGKLIRTFLVNDRTDGMKTLEISNMTIKATKKQDKLTD